ncbi:MAG TPA: GatB/YqeY domain-containing protein [Gemmatimonadaceae bacterium]|nr:GatB/YqeY domain-containing protein [Gemmatimonadaceae bacterium]
MSQLLQKLQADLNASRKAGEKGQTLLLGTIISDIRNREIELKRDVTDEDAVEVLRKGIKRRRESIEMFEKGNRPELAAVEAAQVRQLEAYLPAGATPDEIRAAVRAAIAGGAKNVGAVMSAVMPQLKGRAEGGAINAVVREELAKAG